MNYKPRNDFVLLSLPEKKTNDSNSFALKHEDEDYFLDTATVIATGPGRLTMKGERIDTCLSEGDSVLLNLNLVIKISKDVGVIRENDIACIVK